MNPAGETEATLGRAFGFIGNRGERVVSGVDSTLGFSGGSSARSLEGETDALSPRSLEVKDNDINQQSNRCERLREIIELEQARIDDLLEQIEQQQEVKEGLKGDIERTRFQISELSSPPLKNFLPRIPNAPGVALGFARGAAGILAAELEKRRLESVLENLIDRLNQVKSRILQIENEIVERQEKIEQFQGELYENCGEDDRSNIPIT